jgi:hypothetical protein
MSRVIGHQTNSDDDPTLVCIWPLHTPPTEDDLERINFAYEMTGRRLTIAEVLNLIVPKGRA